MAGRGDISAGKAFVELYVKNNALFKGIQAAQQRLRQFGVGVNQLGKSMMSAGKTTAALGVGLAAPIALATRTFVGFEEQMSKVRAITGASGSDFRKLTEEAKRLGATTSFSASEAAQAMQFLGMAGFDAQQIMSGLPAVLDLAKAGAIDLGQAADIASDVGSAFGFTADQIGRVADVMAVTASSANTSISLMGETLKYSAPLAAAAGQSIEDTAAAIGVLGNSGIKGTMAGTDLALIMKTIAEAGDEGFMDGQVKAIDEATGKIRSIVDIMADLRVATEDMGDSERVQFFSRTFSRAAKSALILTGAGDGFGQLQEKIEGSAGAAAKMAAVMGDNTAGAFKSLMSAIEGAAISIGEALGPTLQDLANWITNVTRQAGEWIKQNPRLIASIAAVAAGVTAAGAALVGIGAIVAAVGTAITATVAAFSTLVAVVTTPISLAVVGGIAGAVYMLRDTFGNASGEIQTHWGAIVDAVKQGDLQGAFEILAATVKLIWAQLLDDLKQKWSRLLLGFKAIGLDAKSIQGPAGERIQELTDEFNATARKFGFFSVQAKLARAALNKAKFEYLLANDPALSASLEGDDLASLKQDVEDTKRRVAEDAARRAAAAERDKLLPPLEELPSSAPSVAALEGAMAGAAAAAIAPAAAAAIEFAVPAIGVAAAAASTGQQNSLFGTFSASALLRAGGGQRPVVDQLRRMQREHGLQMDRLERALREGGRFV